ncbi:DUF4381 domain-containing protein [Shimia sp. SDUM112013]|uniref:DUF4381 domain-containing protein n=1 Tax=Shimia sp. SDUM112013 TaxID=3136160 RepID=UPI0032ED698F
MTEEDFAGKSLVDLLDMLEPVPEPAAISMWPQTQGWLFLLLAVLAIVLWGWLRLRERHRANAYRRAALAALADAGDNPVEVAAILRRTALAAYSRTEVAGLSGEAWLVFLAQTSKATGFDGEAGQRMLAAPYLKDSSPDAPGINALACLWVKTHRVEGAP